MADVDPLSFLDREGFADPNALEPKYLHAGNEFAEQPYVYVDEDSIALVADRKTVVAVDPEFGVLLAGPISFSAMPDQIQFAGGYFRLNPLVLSTLASTTPTPIPALVKATPQLLRGTSGLDGILSGLQDSLGIV